MNNLKPLSGFELVNKGITKSQANLPELGLKDVYPTGSWLEQKQIQAATDARKHLISAERIEKRCSLSHAEWRENLMLAEVTQNTGGHWQFMGHNIGKQLFLTPEETLFLMEINCLLLKHNDLIVSLQQAYSLLFRDKISLTQYMVYASLSRLGYKVIRHKDVMTNKGNCDQREKTKDDVLNKSSKEENKVDENKQINDSEIKSVDNNCAMEVSSINCDNKSDIDMQDVTKATTTQNGSDTDVEHEVSIYQHQIQKIRSRSFKPSDGKNLSKCFKNLPNDSQSETVTVNVPEMEFVPENIRFNKIVYTLNLKEVQSKNARPVTRRYSISDEANGSHIRRLRNVSEGSARRFSEDSTITQSVRERFLARYPLLRPYNFWRPQQNFFQFNTPYRRPFLSMFPPRLHYFPQHQGFYRPHFLANPNQIRNPRKRMRDNAQGFHFDSIKRLAVRLKGLMGTGAPQLQSLHALNRLIHTYNNRYKTCIRLNDDYEIVEEETVVETIEIDDDEGTKESKRPRFCDSYSENVEEIKQLAVRLKELEGEGKATARHRRALSGLVRTFNKSYNAEICVSGDYQVSDRRYITLDSSSESDCAMEPVADRGGGKKLRNPFNVLKRLSEKRAKRRSAREPGTSSDITQSDPIAIDPYNEIEKSIGEGWLPTRDDFGRPQMPTSAAVFTDNMIYNYAKYHNRDWASWAELKVAYLTGMEESAAAFAREECRSIIKPEDCTDMTRVMQKLSVVQSAQDPPATTLKVVYDVYNRDVQNFRKTCLPTPHFRVLCLDQSSTFPAGADIAGLHSKYNDGVTIVFAIVHEGSVSYLQIKNVNLPMYLPNSNLT